MTFSYLVGKRVQNRQLSEARQGLAFVGLS